MADRKGLKWVGALFGTVTCAVVLMSAYVVKSHADGTMKIDDQRTAIYAVQNAQS